MTKNNLIRLTPEIAKRLERNHGEQPRSGRCVICNHDWEDCPHTRGQTGALEDAYRMSQVLPKEHLR